MRVNPGWLWALSWAALLAIDPSTRMPAPTPKAPQAASRTSKRATPKLDPWTRTYPGLDPALGLSQTEQRLVRAMEQDPKLPRSPELEDLLKAWHLEQRFAKVTASLPWQAGPVELPMGGVARFRLPAGFKAVDAAGRASFYTALSRPVPPSATFETPLGVVMTQDQTCLATLVLLHLGHTDDRGPLPAEVILAELNDHRGETAQALARLQHPEAPFVLPSTIRWILPPVVDPQRHTLAWARTGDASLGEHDQFSFVWFGRDTCLLLESPCPREGADFEAYQAQLKPLLDAVAFLPGQTYDDSHGPNGELTLRVLVRGAQTAAEAKTEALKKAPTAIPRSPSFWEFLGANAVRLVSLLTLASAAYVAWRSHRKARDSKS